MATARKPVAAAASPLIAERAALEGATETALLEAADAEARGHMLYGSVIKRAAKFRELELARRELLGAVQQIVKKEKDHPLAAPLDRVHTLYNEYRSLGGLATLGD